MSRRTPAEIICYALSHAGEDGFAIFAADVGRDEVGVQMRHRGAGVGGVAEAQIKCAAVNAAFFRLRLREAQ